MSNNEGSPGKTWTWRGQVAQFAAIIACVFIAKGAIAEPFYVPSGSMEPTLLIGDALVASKFPYGYGAASLPIQITLPETGRLFGDTPRRGDVVVFRWPGDRSQAWVKRVVGLPGDVVEYRDKHLSINGEPVALDIDGLYDGDAPRGAHVGHEKLGDAEHDVLLYPGRFSREGVFEVPEGHYFLMGDNRDNSRDSRYDGVGFVPEANLVGKAVRIWMNWDWSNSGPHWGRIGDKIT